MCCRFSARSQAHSHIFFAEWRQRNTGTVADAIHPVGRRFLARNVHPAPGNHSRHM
jgi:hypothetical protein